MKYFWTKAQTFSEISILYIKKMSFLCDYTPPKPDIGIMVRVFANGSRDLGSIPGRVIPKTQKMVLDATLLNTQQGKD